MLGAAERGSRAVTTAAPPLPPTLARRFAPARLVVGAPETIAAAVAGFSIGPMILLLANHFEPAIAVPLGLLGAVIAVWLCGLPRETPARNEVVCTIVAAAIALLWFVYNVRYTAQDVYATRDPATYTITARWLVDHPSLHILTHPEIFGSPVNGQSATGSYAPVGPGVLNAQGNHLLPALLALSGWTFGVGTIFKANVAFTALALFVFFGLARRVVTPGLALLAMAALAVSMPLIYVGRDTFTEPLTLLFLMGALSLLCRAYKSGRVAEYAIAGVVGGAAAMMRIDSYGGLIGLVAGVTIYTAVARDRRVALVRAGALLAGAALTAFLGWLDLVRLSKQYYDSQHHNIMLLLFALLVVVLAAPFVVALAWRPRTGQWLGAERTRRRIVYGVNGLLVAVFAFLASRPFWYVSHGPFNQDLVNMQIRWGHAIDGTRTYREQSIHWLALYFGWPTVVLAVVGYAVLIAMLVRRRNYALSGVLAMGLSMSALYLWNPQVAPDQPWAMRRFVPEIIPLLLIAAVAAIGWLWQLAREGKIVRAFVVALGVLTVVFPLVVTWPMLHVRDEVPQLSQVTAICSAIGPKAAVVEVDDATIFGYGQTVRSYCNVPAIGLTGASQTQLAAMSAAVRSRGLTLYALSQEPGAATTPFADRGPGAALPPAFMSVTVQRWPTQINVAPTVGDSQRYTVWLSMVDSTGLAHPLAPVP